MARSKEEEDNVMSFVPERVYYVVFLVTAYESIEEAFAKEPELLAAHIARSEELHAHGTLLMAGTFLNNPQEPMTAMAVHTTRKAAEEYAKGDPFVQKGLVRTWYIREWANMFA